VTSDGGLPLLRQLDQPAGTDRAHVGVGGVGVSVCWLLPPAGGNGVERNWSRMPALAGLLTGHCGLAGLVFHAFPIAHVARNDFEQPMRR
jgi:hypothetical protein